METNEPPLRYVIDSSGDANVDFVIFTGGANFSETYYYALTDSSNAIDIGDPDDELIALEPLPNGRRVNVGAYGGTVLANKSLPVGRPASTTGSATSLMITPYTRPGETSFVECGVLNIGKSDLHVYFDSLSWEEGQDNTDRFSIPFFQPFDVAADSVETFQVFFEPFEDDNIQFNVNLLLNTDGGLLRYTIRGTTYNPIIEITPMSIDFGTVNLYRPDTVDIEIANIGTTNLELGDLAFNTNHFRMRNSTPTNISPDTSYLYGVICRPRNYVGGLNDSLMVRNNDRLVSVHLTAFIEGAIISTDYPDSSDIDFQFLDVDSVRTLPVKFLNVGNSDLEIYNVTSTNPDFYTDLEEGGRSVEQGDSTNLLITFDPTNVQVYEDTLTVFTNADTLTYLLFGRGTQGGIYFANEIPNPDFDIPEVWGANDDTVYICAGPSTIISSDKLIILEGVRVYFEADDYYLQVEGTLEILGTEEDPVIFAPQNSTFAGLRFVACDPDTRLNWLVIQNSSALEGNLGDVDVNDYYLYNGGGIAMHNSNPTLFNVTVQNCYSDHDGGGIWCFQSMPTMIQCTVSNNQAEENGGGMCIWGPSPYMHCSFIRDNVANGNGGGMYIRSNSYPVISNSIIANNEAGAAGGAVYAWDHSSPVFLNDVVYGNSAESAGSVLTATGRAIPIFRNSVIWGHEGDLFTFGTDGGAVARYTDIQDLDVVAEIIDVNSSVMDVDPGFIDTNEFRLSATSPLVNAGDPSSMYEDTSIPPAYDGPRADIGAYGGPYSSYWTESPVRITFFRNPGSSRSLEILINALGDLDSDPELQVKTVAGTADVALSSVGTTGDVWHANLVIDETTEIEATVTSVVGGETVLFRRSMDIAVFKPTYGADLADRSGNRLLLPPEAYYQEMMITAEPDMGASLPDELPLAAPAGSRWNIQCSVDSWNKSAEVILPYDSYTVRPGQENGLAIWRFDGEEWTRLESFVNTASYTVHGTTDGPGLFIIAYDPEGDHSTYLPNTTVLGANYPNPFNPSTTIPFELQGSGVVDLRIYNLLGQEIARIGQGWYTTGLHNATWNGRDNNGSDVASGVYFYRLRFESANGSGTFEQTRKLLLMR